MDNFHSYLKTSKALIQNITNNSNVHIIMGNESLDLDSTVSAILLAFLLSKHKPVNVPASSLVIPIINISYDLFLIRKENCLVLKEANIDLSDLIYRNSINFEELVNKTNVTVTMVDHHVLSVNDKVLKDHVVQIFDHRPVDTIEKWDREKVQINILPVGSCASLIAEHIFKTDEDILTKETAYMLYETIIYDTVALSPDVGKAKELDIAMIQKLERKFNFVESHQDLFERLWSAHSDISGLSPKQLLYKDLKCIDSITVPGLPMLVEDYLNISGAYEAVREFAKENNSSIVLLVGQDTKGQVRRDMAVYCTNDKTFGNILTDKLKNSRALKGYDFILENVETNFNDILLFKQKNTKLSRKQIIPCVKDAVKEQFK